jgi:MoaA/NifB/PqqE/SkfB family radical SAM enzyme
MPSAQWIIEPVRGCFDRARASELSIDQWQQLKNSLGKLLPGFFNTGRYKLNRLFEYGLMALRTGKQPVPCLAGNEFIAINYRGYISACETLPVTGINVRQLDYNINRLLSIEEWNSVLNGINCQKCHCTHFCWLIYSMIGAGCL